MICLLGEPEDVDLLWLAVSLRERGQVVEVVLPEELMFGSSLSYRIDSTSVSWELRLRDERVLEPGHLALVVNRMAGLPPTGADLAPADATFVAEEWRAALAAWLRTLTCPVLNPPRAASLAGPLMSTVAWRAIAHANGLACQPWRSGEQVSPRDPVTLTCVGQRCIDPGEAASEDVRRALLATAAYVGAPLLAATFDRVAATPVFFEADVFPELMMVGVPLLDALVELASKGEGTG